MASFDKVLAAQKQDFASIKRHVQYLKSLNDETRTLNIIRNRCTLLDNLLRMCRDRNGELFQLSIVENKEDHNYFIDDEFGIIEMKLYADLDYFSEIMSELQPTKQFVTSSPLSMDDVYQQPGSTVKLPQINLPEFSGQFSQWQVFKDSFNSLIIENSSLNNLAKLHFLKSSLSGDALDLIFNIKTTSDNFKIAWELLINRYDNKRAIVTAHLNAIFSLEPLKKESAGGLLQIYNTIQKHISALKNLGRPTEDYSDILVNRVINLLDQKTQRDWELSISTSTECPKYSDLSNFLLQRIRVLEAIPSSNSNNGTAPKLSGSQSNLKDTSKVKRLNVNAHVASAKEDICVLCKQNHYLYHCPKYQEKSTSDKYNFVKSQKLCTNCLRYKHKTIDCNSKFTCLKCKKRHHTSLHREDSNTNQQEKKLTSENNQSNSGLQVIESSFIQSHYSDYDNPIKSKSVLLSTARVWVISPNLRTIRVRALIDPGSTWSFVSKDLAKLLNSKSIPVTATLSVLGGALAGTANSAIEIGISPTPNGNLMFKTNALVIPKVTNYIPEKRLPFEAWSHLDGLNLADDAFNDDPIHLLIGAELYGALILDGIKKGNPNESVALNTAFRWILSGNISTKISNNELDIQEIQKPKLLSPDDELCDEHFRKTHSRNLDGQYVVQLPFTSDKPIDIGSTRPIAEKSLKRIEKRFKKNSDLKKSYVEFMNEYESLNHMRLAQPLNSPNNQVVYTPHHPVCRSSSQTTKVRAVFHASVLSSNGTSLNDHLKIVSVKKPEILSHLTLSSANMEIENSPLEYVLSDISDAISNIVEDNDDIYIPDGYQEEKVKEGFTQEELSNLIRDFKLPKNGAEYQLDRKMQK
ncbi:uncharacterized protein LOC122510805 [Leptopilina heterotoma]|uniref:uncharacterized protein LOC122510805 n=1 Tax=Leptopilina heterotoma TaxID=63436 RepID=UPI001CA9054A|nr:uncharacterized protein LOC122510805 [Leptopilina heterotoma]